MPATPPKPARAGKVFRPRLFIPHFEAEYDLYRLRTILGEEPRHRHMRAILETLLK